MSDLIHGAILLPALASLLIWAAGRRPNLREGVTLATAVALLLIVLQILTPVLAGARPATDGLEVLPGLELAFAVEPLGMLFALIASALWIVNSVYSIGYMRGNAEPRQTLFYVCFAVSLAATMMIAFSANLFTLFIGYEILTISTYPLVVHKGTEESRKAGRVYLLLLLGTSMVLLLPAIIAVWVLAGTLDFAQGGTLAGTLPPLAMGALLALFVFGIGKAAVMPVHFWLPAAMVAPTPVSALLHAVAVVKAGVFTVVKVIVYIFGVDALRESGAADWLVYVAGFTVIAASIVALRQDNLKMRLAYSTVSQLSYVVLAAALLTPLSILGAAMHIAAHAVSKITLFFAAGSVYTAAHITEIPRMDGVGRRMPWTMAAFAIGSISMIGLPPTAGFLGKWFILEGAVGTAQWAAMIVVVISTMLNAAYFLPIVYRAFFVAPPPDSHDHGEAPWPVVLALTVTAAGTVALFLLPGIPLSLAEQLAGVAR